MLLVSGGTLLWGISNFNKFLIKDKLDYKLIYLIVLGLLTASCTLLVISKLNLMLGFNLLENMVSVNEAAFIAWGMVFYLWSIFVLSIYIVIYFIRRL